MSRASRLMTVAALAAAWSGMALAQSPPPSTDDLVHALTPGQPGMKTRGLHVSNAPLSTGGTAERPSVALDIPFALNSADLSAGADDVVKRLGAALSAPQLTPYRFRVEGHTDASGPDAYDQDLSQRRAETVKRTLVETYHVAANRLEAVGLGKSKPLDPSDPMNPANRRVQVVNVGG